MLLRWLLLALLGLPSAQAGEKEKDVCRLWMAPSTLTVPNTVQYGLFAGIDFSKDDILPDVELAIPYVDFFIDGNKGSIYTKLILDYLENQMWTADYSGAKYEGNVTTTPFIPGAGSLGNYHTLVANADWLSAASILREREKITEPGKPHLSRGAITNVYNVTMVAIQRIPAGMEIFPNYGDMWDKGEPSQYQDKYTRRDIIDADKVLDHIIDFYDRYESQMSDDLKEEMLDFMLDKVLGAAGGNRAAMIRSLIPQNYRKIRKVKEAGGTFLYRNRDAIKNQKWLEKNGFCVDNMYSGMSTIPAAGRGAFASRDISEGETISIIPTVLFGTGDLMNMYDVVAIETNEDENAQKFDYDRSRPRGQQLGVNYAFGHPESSFMFLPIAPMVHYINHNSNPNAVLQWSTHSTMRNDKATWDHSVREVMNFKSNMVVFEIEATKDIKKGDEIFIDYGDEWVETWEKYQNNWKLRHENKPWPLRAEDVKMAFKEKPYPVAASPGSGNLLPPGVATACFIKIGIVPDGQPGQTDDGTPIHCWVGPTEYWLVSGASLTLCDLTERREDGKGSYNYTATATVQDDGETFFAHVIDIPHAAVTVVDAPYSCDIHGPDAFRHFIGIPNEIFPQTWRDLR